VDNDHMPRDPDWDVKQDPVRDPLREGWGSG
jgi:hypothetical protein